MGIVPELIPGILPSNILDIEIFKVDLDVYDLNNNYSPK